MPKSESTRIEALESLLRDRRKHESFLAKLEERRASTPEGVYRKLREEYQTRLTDLQVRAAAEAEGLAEDAESDSAAVAEIEERLEAAHEERIEGELRAEVGEFEPKDWAKKQAVLNATIAQLEKERDARKGATERLRELLKEAGRPPEPLAPTSQVKEPSTGPSRSVATDRHGSGPSRPASPISGAPSFDELAFLNSVVGRASQPVAAPSRPSKPVAAQPEETSAPATKAEPMSKPAKSDSPSPVEPTNTAATEGSGDEPKSGPSYSGPSGEPPSVPTSPVSPAPGSAGGTGTPPAPTGRSFLEPSTDPIIEPRSHSSASPADDEPPGPLGRPTPRTSEAIKTLKCQECGTLNYPTEWYCERCGGELAAL